MQKFQIGLTKDQKELLETLMEDCGARSLKAVFNTAFIVLDWVIASRKSGYAVGRMDEMGNFEELDMQGFPPVRDR